MAFRGGRHHQVQRPTERRRIVGSHPPAQLQQGITQQRSIIDTRKDRLERRIPRRVADFEAKRLNRPIAPTKRHGNPHPRPDFGLQLRRNPVAIDLVERLDHRHRRHQSRPNLRRINRKPHLMVYVLVLVRTSLAHQTPRPPKVASAPRGRRRQPQHRPQAKTCSTNIHPHQLEARARTRSRSLTPQRPTHYTTTAPIVGERRTNNATTRTKAKKPQRPPDRLR